MEKDGGEYVVVRGDKIANTGVFSWTRDEASLNICFNRLINVEEIKEIRITAVHCGAERDSTEEYIIKK